jgi:putative Ca2+/H+ antiporter (TMEM165/GDT1 family)
MELQIFITVFSLIFIAELPDKTAFAAFMMATRGQAGAVFTGVAGAFIVQSLVAVLCGSVIGLLPEKIVHTAAGLLFLAFAAHTAFFHDKEEAEAEKETKPVSKRMKFWPAATKAFIVIFVAEWGDLTQIATASLAARFHGHPITVFSAATLALWAVTAIAVLAGKKAGHVVHVKVLKIIGAVFMTAAGLYFIIDAWI